MVLLGVLATLALSLPGSAFAADTSIVVNWANSVEGDLGVLQVSVTSGQEITGLKAHVLASGTGEEVAATEDFVLYSGTAANGVWRTRDTFKLDRLDTYPVTVDATAADGTQVTADRVGHLSYYAQTVFDPLTSNRATVTYAHRDIVVRGRLLSRAPDTREVTPFAGATVYLNWREYGLNGDDDIGTDELTTGADGRFSSARTLNGANDFDAYYSYQNDLPGHLGAGSAGLRVAVKQSPVRLTEKVTPRRLNAGGEITVSGLARWKSPTGWRPLTGAHLIIGPYWPGWAQADTDADGRYSAAFVPYDSTDVPVTYVTTDPFVAGATTTAHVTVAQPSLIREFSAQRGEPGTIEVSGALDFPGAASPGDPVVDIEFSADGTTWHRKATLPSTTRFSGTIAAKRPGYWRAHYRGDRNFQPFIGEAMYADPR